MDSFEVAPFNLFAGDLASISDEFPSWRGWGSNFLGFLNPPFLLEACHSDSLSERDSFTGLEVCQLLRLAGSKFCDLLNLDHLFPDSCSFRLDSYLRLFLPRRWRRAGDGFRPLFRSLQLLASCPGFSQMGHTLMLIKDLSSLALYPLWVGGAFPMDSDWDTASIQSSLLWRRAISYTSACSLAFSEWSPWMILAWSVVVSTGWRI